MEGSQIWAEVKKSNYFSKIKKKTALLISLVIILDKRWSYGIFLPYPSIKTKDSWYPFLDTIFIEDNLCINSLGCIKSMSDRSNTIYELIMLGKVESKVIYGSHSHELM